MRRLTSFVTDSIGQQHPDFTHGVAFSIMLAFSICGFFLGYLMTRLFLPRAFESAETADSKLVAEVGLAALDPVSSTVIPSATVLSSGIQRALSVKNVSKNVSEQIIRGEINSLAKVYEALRLSMSSGDERTKAMEQIASQMKSLGLAVQPFLKDLQSSESAGERLAAITSLEIAPQEEALDWLAERLNVERPFMGYRAALALLSAARAFTPPSPGAPDSSTQTASASSKGRHTHVCEAIDKAMKILEDKNLRSTDRYEVLITAKSEGMCP